jgi:hypothetical protein
MEAAVVEEGRRVSLGGMRHGIDCLVFDLVRTVVARECPSLPGIVGWSMNPPSPPGAPLAVTSAFILNHVEAEASVTIARGDVAEKAVHFPRVAADANGAHEAVKCLAGFFRDMGWRVTFPSRRRSA